MSDSPATTTTTDATPRKASKSRKPVKFSAVHTRYAAKKGIDTTRAAKLNRSYVRSNFDAIAKMWPELRAANKVNRDSNRYPETMPAKVADAIVNRSL